MRKLFSFMFLFSVLLLCANDSNAVELKNDLSIVNQLEVIQKAEIKLVNFETFFAEEGIVLEFAPLIQSYEFTFVSKQLKPPIDFKKLNHNLNHLHRFSLFRC